MKKSIIGISIFVALTSTALHAVEIETLWDQAADFYDRGDFTSAIENYSKLMEKGYINSELYYNLGNSYFKSDRLGMAIWAYRRALLLDSDLDQARNNLDIARSMNLDRIEVQGGGFITDIWDFLTGLFGYNEYLLLFTAAWWILAIFGAILLYRGNFASWPYYLLIIAFILAIFSATAAARRIRVDRLTTWGVLVDNSADIREGPGSDYERIEIGHEGLEFKILNEREDSYLIELKNGLKGWIDKKAVLEI